MPTKRERRELKRRQKAYLSWYQRACLESQFPEEAPCWREVAKRLARALDIVLPAVRDQRRHLINAALEHHEAAEAAEERLQEAFRRGDYVFAPAGAIVPADRPLPPQE